jgi:hypothetical protein
MYKSRTYTYTMHCTLYHDYSYEGCAVLFLHLYIVQILCVWEVFRVNVRLRMKDLKKGGGVSIFSFAWNTHVIYDQTPL